MAIGAVAALMLSAPLVTFGDNIPIGSYSFITPGAVSGSPTTIKITAKAKDGTTFVDEFTFGDGFGADSVRDTVESALSAAGWNVSNSGGKGINITGTKATATKLASPIQEVDGGQAITNRALGGITVSEDGSSGVKMGTATVGQEYKFSFLPLFGPQPILLTDGTVTATLNSEAITANVFAGEDANQVAQALFNAMLADSVSATLIGNEISFISDSTGSEVLYTDLTLDADGLESLISVPQRTDTPEPATVSLFAAGSLSDGHWMPPPAERAARLPLDPSQMT